MAEILSTGNSHSLWVSHLKQLQELLALGQRHEPVTISLSVFGSDSTVMDTEAILHMHMNNMYLSIGFAAFHYHIALLDPECLTCVLYKWKRTSLKRKKDKSCLQFICKLMDVVTVL